MPLRGWPLAWIPLFIAACTGSGETDRDEPAAPPPPGIAVFVDDERVATVPLASLDESVELVSALPAGSPSPETWTAVEAEASLGRHLMIGDPAKTYAGQRVELLMDPSGQPMLAFRHPPNPELPPHIQRLARLPTANVVGVHTVRVHTKPPPAVETPTPPPIRLRVAGRGVVTPSSDQLDALPTHEAPRAAKGSQWWALADLVALGAPLPDVASVELLGGPEPVTRTAAQLAHTDRAHLIKHNRQGQLRYREWRLGEQPAVELTIEHVEQLDITVRTAP